MSSSSSIDDSASKITCAMGCDHQLPTIGSPAIASATLGTGPRAEASTTPCCSTNFAQFLVSFDFGRAAFFGAAFFGRAAFFALAFGFALDFDFGAAVFFEAGFFEVFF